MTKQEEIREGMAQRGYEAMFDLYWEDLNPNGIERTLWLTVADRILSYLHSQGGRLKVKCPNCQDGYVIFRTNKTRCSICKGKGYLIEPLIKEA